MIGLIKCHSTISIVFLLPKISISVDSHQSKALSDIFRHRCLSSTTTATRTAVERRFCGRHSNHADLSRSEMHRRSQSSHLPLAEGCKPPDRAGYAELTDGPGGYCSQHKIGRATDRRNYNLPQSRGKNEDRRADRSMEPKSQAKSCLSEATDNFGARNRFD
jgi:hypothetical protein